MSARPIVFEASMKYIVLVLAISMIVNVSARGEAPSKEPAAATVTSSKDAGASSPTQTAAQDFIALLRQEKFDDAVKRFDATMTKGVPVESLRAIWQK